MDELKKLLENVSDTYDDFVGCVLCAVKHDDEEIRKVKDYIKEDPARKSDDILEYLDELGI